MAIADHRQWIVSRFVSVSWSEGMIAVRSAATGAHLQGIGSEMLPLLDFFASPRRLDEAEAIAGRDSRRVRIEDLVRSGILVPADTSEAADLAGWTPESLAYHRNSRRPPKLGSPPPQAPVRETGQDVTRLPEAGFEETSDFPSVLDRRHSCRAWSSKPVPLDELARFLWMSARERPRARASGVAGPSAGGEAPARAYPSGGGLYSLRLYVLANEGAVGGLGPGAYLYCPRTHVLSSILTGGSSLERFLYAAGAAAGGLAPPVLLVLTSAYPAAGKRYGALAYSLILKEVGALFQTFYLVAAHLGLGACALGGGISEHHFARLLGTDRTVEPVIGEFMLGYPVDPQPDRAGLETRPRD